MGRFFLGIHLSPLFLSPGSPPAPFLFVVAPESHPVMVIMEATSPTVDRGPYLALD